MTGNVEHIIGAAGDAEISVVGATDGGIARKVRTFEFGGEIAFLETFGIAPDRADHAGPWTLDNEHATGAVRQVVSLFIHNGGHDARHGAGA